MRGSGGAAGLDAAAADAKAKGMSRNNAARACLPKQRRNIAQRGMKVWHL